MSERELRIEKRWLLAARIDPEKFFRFYDKYRPQIYRYVLLRTGDEDAARESQFNVNHSPAAPAASTALRIRLSYAA